MFALPQNQNPTTHKAVFISIGKQNWTIKVVSKSFLNQQMHNFAHSMFRLNKMKEMS